MIRYKVVSSKDNRSSCSLAPDGNEYIKYYRKGETVKANKGTLGIFVFKTKKQANNFIKNRRDNEGSYFILKVKSIGKGESPKFVCGCPLLLMLIWDTSKYLNQFYKYGEKSNLQMKPPEGTICYPAVKVLE